MKRERDDFGSPTAGKTRWALVALGVAVSPQLRVFPGRSSKLSASSRALRSSRRWRLPISHRGRVADDLFGAAAQLGARHWRRVNRAGYWAGDVAGERGVPFG